jgi:hypothetical protein
MRFLNISGPGVAQDEDFCPNCHVLLDERHDYKTCPLCKYDTRQGVRQRRVQMRRRSHSTCSYGCPSPARLRRTSPLVLEHRYYIAGSRGPGTGDPTCWA